MKTVNKDELFRNLSGFLKSKGIELQDGSYTQRIRQGCHVLADAVNATQTTAKRAKVEVGRKLGQLRQTIHEATAPTSAPPPTAFEPSPTAPTAKPTTAREPERKSRRRPAKAGARRANRRRKQ